MAGDWMKVELETPDKPEVQSIAAILNLDADAVFGKLFRVWSWFDKHTRDGNAHGVTYSLVDRISGVTGFAEAMAFVGWLHQDGHALILPNFDRHNGKTAKNRALGAKRTQNHRVKSNAESNATCNASIVTPALPEKRREENKEKNKPGRKTAMPSGFCISDEVRLWAEKSGHSRLQERYDSFVDLASSRGYKYVDWDSAFKRAIREDWAKLGNSANGVAQVSVKSLKEVGLDY